MHLATGDRASKGREGEEGQRRERDEKREEEWGGREEKGREGSFVCPSQILKPSAVRAIPYCCEQIPW